MSNLFPGEVGDVSPYETRRLHAFKYDWLQRALSAEEYAAVSHNSISLLRELYPSVDAFGPRGLVLAQMMLHLRAALDGALVKDPDSVATLRDLVNVYGKRDPWRGATSDQVALPNGALGSTWDLVYMVCQAVARVEHLLADIDMSPDPLVASVVEHPAWGTLISNPGAWPEHLSKSTMLDTFGALIMAEDLMWGQPGFAEVLSQHVAFLARQGWV